MFWASGEDGVVFPNSCFTVFFAPTFWPCPMAYGILVPRPGIKPSAPALEGKVLTTRPSGKPRDSLFRDDNGSRAWKRRKVSRRRLQRPECPAPPTSFPAWRCLGSHSHQKCRSSSGEWSLRSRTARTFSPLPRDRLLSLSLPPASTGSAFLPGHDPRAPSPPEGSWL